MHGITAGRDYARMTNETYLGLFGKPAQKLKEDRGLAKGGGDLRDHFDEVELASLALAETLAKRKIDRDNWQGVQAWRRLAGRSPSASGKP